MNKHTEAYITDTISHNTLSKKYNNKTDSMYNMDVHTIMHISYNPHSFLKLYTHIYPN